MTASAVYLDAVLEPPRSLSPSGLTRVMLALGGMSFLLSMGFLLIGAYPVVGFMGAEVFLLWYLLRRFVRRAGPRTYIRITAESIEVCRISPRGREVFREHLPSYFARVVHDVRVKGAHALRIVSGRRSFAIGEHLSDDERSTLAARIHRALQDARSERFDSEVSP